MFVRTDLPVAHQLVQSNHATYTMAALIRPEPGTPNLIMIGVPDVRALERVRNKLEKAQIPHYNWHEPDYDFGFTAIATAPLHGEQRKVMGNYRVYRGGDEKSSCRVMPDSPTNLPLAQNTERSVLT